MKKLIILFFSFSIQASYDAIINLGGDCQVQYQLKINKLRPYALPFDFLIIPFESLYKILEHSFEYFLDTTNFALITKDEEKWIEDLRYGTRFIHDFRLESNFLDDYKIVEEKYARRIARLNRLLSTHKNILFIRKKITREQSILLDMLLQKLYPHLIYLIICLDNTEEIKQNWNLPRIRNFFLRQTEPYKWSGDNQAWKEIFQALGLEAQPTIPFED